MPVMECQKPLRLISSESHPLTLAPLLTGTVTVIHGSPKPVLCILLKWIFSLINTFNGSEVLFLFVSGLLTNLSLDALEISYGGGKNQEGKDKCNKRNGKAKGNNLGGYAFKMKRLHFITLVAIERTFSGILMSIAFAVFRLIIKSYLSGASTGMVPGLAPIKTLSTSLADCLPMS